MFGLLKIVAKADDAQLERLIAAHEDVATHLAKRSSEDQAYDVRLSGWCQRQID